MRAEMRPWKYRTIGAASRPRQFEYHPSRKEWMVFGTMDGLAVVYDHHAHVPVQAFDIQTDDSLLGLCWLRRNARHFIAGTASGNIELCELAVDEADDYLTRSSDASTGIPAERQRPISSYEPFQELTSVHVNCEDQYLLASGYHHDVRVYDVETKQIVRQWTEAHSNHINISRFTNSSPTIFATSSFDKSIKLWDTRDSDTRPIYTRYSEHGHVMLAFSPDDQRILSSAVDNEIRQYSTFDGRLYVRIPAEKTNRSDNYTRSYYSSSGNMILSGSSEEQVVRFFCSHTGRPLESVVMYPGRGHSSIYIQSLRGSPHCESEFSVLANYHDPTYPLEIIKVCMDTDESDSECGNDNTSDSLLQSFLPSKQLAQHIYAVFDDESSSDIHLRVGDRVFFLHRIVLGSRSPRFLALLKEWEQTQIGSQEHPSADFTLPAEPQWTPTALQILLKYLYSDELLMGDTTVPSASHLDGLLWPNSSPKSAVYEERQQNESEAPPGSNHGVVGGVHIEEVDESSEDILHSEESILPDMVQHLFSSESHRNSVDLRLASELVDAGRYFGTLRLVSLVAERCKVAINLESVLNIVLFAHEKKLDKLCEYGMYFIVSNYDVVSRNVQLERLPRELHSALYNELHEDIVPLSSFARIVGTPEQSLVCSGHSCIALPMENRLLFLGGGNKHQYISFRQALMLHTEQFLWNKINTHGDIPPSMVYHTCNHVCLDGKDFVLLMGMGRCNGSMQTLSYLLELRSMEWKKASFSDDGRPPPPRTAHTLNAVPREVMEKKSSRTSSIEADFDLTLSLPTFVLFGGYDSVARTSHCDIMLISFSPSTGTHLPSIKWRQRTPLGDAPRPRLGHTSTFMWVNSEAYLVVFGGAGHGYILNDTDILHMESSTCMKWVEKDIQGQLPATRYGHTAQLLPNNDLILFGGTSGHENHQDIYCFNMIQINSMIIGKWSRIDTRGVPPTPRSRHTSAMVDEHCMVVFGGTDGRFEHLHSRAFDVSLYKYDSLTMTWTTEPSKMIVPGSEPAVTVPHGTMARDLRRFVQSKEFEDTKFRLVLDDKTTRECSAHSVVLTQRCKQLNIMLRTSGMRESQEGQIQLRSSFEWDVLRPFLMFLYTDKLEVHQKDLLELAAVANEYNLETLTVLCEGMIIQAVDHENVMSLVAFADMHSLCSLKSACIAYILKHYAEISSSNAEEWTTLPLSLEQEIATLRASREHIFRND